jgi:hypothetical protein
LFSVIGLLGVVIYPAGHPLWIRFTIQFARRVMEGHRVMRGCWRVMKNPEE